MNAEKLTQKCETAYQECLIQYGVNDDPMFKVLFFKGYLDGVSDMMNEIEPARVAIDKVMNELA